MKVPLLDLKATHAPMRDELVEAFERILDSGAFILGEEVSRFERFIADLCGATSALGVSSGSDALLIALMALEIKPGDEVITTDYSFFATAGAIVRLGATPVFVDIDPKTFNIDPEAVRRAVTAKTRAIIPVHLFGQAVDMDRIMAIADEFQLPVIEDGAQAIGTELSGGRRANGVGTIGCLSFFPSKNLGALGDAGAVVTSDPALYERMKALRVHGARVKYHHDLVGGNFRIDALQAAMLRVKLDYLDQWTAARQANAGIYRASFAVAVDDSRLQLPVDTRPELPRGHVYNQFVISVPRRDSLKAFLAERDIQTEIYYPIPFHRQRCFAGLPHGDFPESDRAAADALALPIHPALRREQLEFVVDSIAAFLHRHPD